MELIDPEIEAYARQKSTLPGSAARELAEHTQQHEDMARMLCGEMVGSFLGLTVRMTGARRILEIGTFSGYSALCMAENLPEGGELHTIDVKHRDYTARFWQKSRHAGKIVTHTGTALDVIPTLEGRFDLVFIDADKENYSPYLELSLERLSERGVIIVDNVLWSGRVLQPDGDLRGKEYESSTLAIKRFNDQVAARDDLYTTLLPVRDGLLLICKKTPSQKS